MIPVGEVLAAIGRVGAELATDLLPLFQQHLPQLRTQPLPAAEEEMHDARADALRRAGGQPPPPVHDTDPAMPAVRPEEPEPSKR